MQTVEEMVSRARELETLASNPNIEPSRRNAMQDERLNLLMLIQKDPQRGAERQQQRIKEDAEYTKKMAALMTALSEADNAYALIPSGNQQARDRQMDKILDLRMQIQRHAEIKAAV